MAEEKGVEGKLLIVSWTLFPWPSGSSVIVNNIASAFSRDELILFGEGNRDHTYDGWPEGNPKIYRSYPRAYPFKRGVRLLRWLQLGSVIREIRAVIQKEHVTRVICVFPNDFYLLAAFRASLMENVAFYSWFHNTYLDNVTGYRKFLARWLQPIIFKASKQIYVMSDGMKSYFNVRYPKYNFRVLRHGFDLPVSIPRSKPINKDQHRSFVFTGSLNSSCEDAAVRLMKIVLSDPKAKLHVFSGNKRQDFERRNIKGDQVIFHKFIPLTKLYQELPKYDVMLLPHGFEGKRTDVEFKTIFPTRTIPLLVSGRPILAHSPKDAFFTEFLQTHQCALVVDDKDPEQLVEALHRLEHDQELVDRLVDNAVKTSRLFDLNKVSGQIRVEVLND